MEHKTCAFNPGSVQGWLSFAITTMDIKSDLGTRFIPCDVFRLLLRATGGFFASIALHGNKLLDIDENIVLGGFAYWVLMFLIVMSPVAIFFSASVTDYAAVLPEILPLLAFGTRHRSRSP